MCPHLDGTSPDTSHMARKRNSLRAALKRGEKVATKGQEAELKRMGPKPKTPQHPRPDVAVGEDDRKHFTDAAIKSLPLPAKSNKVHYDGSVPGFGIRITAGGARAFILNYRVRGSGRERRYTIGSF